MYSKSELILVHHVANGRNTVESLAEAMHMSVPRVYAIVNSLKGKRVLADSKGVGIGSDAFAIRISSVMRPSIDRAGILADSGMEMLMSLRDPMSVDQIVHTTGLSRATVFRRLKSARSMGAVKKVGDRYVLNDRMWAGLREMLDSIEDHESVWDPRIVNGSEIYRKDRDGVLYSYPSALTDQRTAFSAFGDYGLDIGLDTVYYTTSDEPLDIDRVFDDAFTVCEKTGDYMLRVALMMFYERNSSSIHADPRFLSAHDRIFAGDRIPGWPVMCDLEERLAL